MRWLKQTVRCRANKCRHGFDGLSFEKQIAVLDTLSASHSKLRSTRIAELRRELAAIGDELSSLNSAEKKNGKASKVQVKYRDPATGDTWSGRGRMSSWLAAKVKAGEKASRYLIK